MVFGMDISVWQGFISVSLQKFIKLSWDIKYFFEIFSFHDQLIKKNGLLQKGIDLYTVNDPKFTDSWSGQTVKT